MLSKMPGRIKIEARGDTLQGGRRRGWSRPARFTLRGLARAGAPGASSTQNTRIEVLYALSRASRRHSPGVIFILSVNTRRNAATDR